MSKEAWKWTKYQIVHVSRSIKQRYKCGRNFHGNIGNIMDNSSMATEAWSWSKIPWQHRYDNGQHFYGDRSMIMVENSLTTEARKWIKGSWHSDKINRQNIHDNKASQWWNFHGNRKTTMDETFVSIDTRRWMNIHDNISTGKHGQNFYILVLAVIKSLN